MKDMCKRFIILVIGIFFVSFGVSLTVKSLLGTSPITSIPYVCSLDYPFSLGTWNIIFNIGFVVVQILILRRQFKWIQLAQILMAFGFGYFIDLSMYVLQNLHFVAYYAKFIGLLCGITIIAFGVALEVMANIIMLPADNIVKVIAAKWNFDFGVTKTCFDVSMVLIAAVLSWGSFQEIHGIREGTLVAALFTGSIARVFIRVLQRKNLQRDMVCAEDSVQ